MKKFILSIAMTIIPLQLLGAPLIIDGRSLSQSEEKLYQNIFRIRTFTPDGRASGCTSILIAPRVFLTAAHCLSKGTAIIILNKSENNLEQTLKIEDIAATRIFPFYDAKNVDRRNQNEFNDNRIEAGDLGLIILKKDLGDSFAPAKKYTYFKLKLAAELKDSNPSDLFSLLGFGSRTFEEARMHYDLQLTELKNFFETKIYAFSDGEIQAQSIKFRNYHIGVGDSGGPVFIQRDQEHFLIGINSLITKSATNETKDESFSYHAAFTKDVICWITATSPYLSKLCPSNDPILEKYKIDNTNHEIANRELTLKVKNEILNQEYKIQEENLNYQFKLTFLEPQKIYKLSLTGAITDTCYFKEFKMIQDHTDLASLENLRDQYNLLSSCEGNMGSYNLLVKAKEVKIKRY